MKQKRYLALITILALSTLYGCSRPEIVKEVATLTAGELAAMNAAVLKEFSLLNYEQLQIEGETENLHTLTFYYQNKVNEFIGDWKASNQQEKRLLLDTLREIDSTTLSDLALTSTSLTSTSKSQGTDLTQLGNAHSAVSSLTGKDSITPKELYPYAKDVIEKFKKLQDAKINSPK